MKAILTTLCILISIASQAQKMKINTAIDLYQHKRYFEANELFKELITEGQLNVENADSVFRMAAFSAKWGKDLSFEQSIYEQLIGSSKVKGCDVYDYFFVCLKNGNYGRALELRSLPVVSELTSDQKAILNAYKTGEIFKTAEHQGRLNVVDVLPNNSNKGDFASSFYPGGIVISSSREAFASKWSFDNSSFLNIYITKDSLKTVDRLGYLCDKHHDGTAYYDSIDKLWYYARNYAPKRGRYSTTGIFIYSEQTRLEVPFAFNDDNFFLAQPFLNSSRDTLWFSSDRQGSIGKADIWFSVKQNGIWSEPKNAGEKINSIENEMFPSLFNNQLYFASNGHPGMGSLDIFRFKLTDMSSHPENLGTGVNSSYDDFAILLAGADRKGFFSSNRDNQIDRVYAVQLKFVEFFYKGKLIPESASTNLEELKLLVKENGKVIDTLYPTKNGEFIFKGIENKNYEISLDEDKFLPLTDVFSTIGKTETDTVYRELQLKSKYVSVDNLVVDSKTKKPISNASVHVKNLKTGMEETYHTDMDGHLKMELLKSDEYDVRVSNKGFIDENHKMKFEPKDIAVQKTVPLKAISKGTKVEVEHVFYDYGKASLRPESKTELDKIVVFLKENPGVKVELSSHTDSRGGNEQNLTLSQKRAQSCVDYLLSQGVNKNQIVAKGYGETQLLNKCKDGVKCSEQEHQKNRRTEMKVLSVSN